MTELLTQTTQDYLKTIYAIAESEGLASTTALATRLGISPASVTGMLQRLASSDPPLIEYFKHQGAALTPAGKRAALEVIRHHRLIETYLVETLGYSWDEVHAEADKLEHVISEEFEAKISAVLGNPMRDPHGELIPSVDLIMPVDTTTPLSELRPPLKAVIIWVRADNTALLRHLENLELTPGELITIKNFSPFDQNFTLQVEKNMNTFVIGKEISSRIYVEIINEKPPKEEVDV
jgi:DtxR family Mn-dependent transcriptional regulator